VLLSEAREWLAAKWAEPPFCGARSEKVRERATAARSAVGKLRPEGGWGKIGAVDDLGGCRHAQKLRDAAKGSGGGKKVINHWDADAWTREIFEKKQTFFLISPARKKGGKMNGLVLPGELSPTSMAGVDEKGRRPKCARWATRQCDQTTIINDKIRKDIWKWDLFYKKYTILSKTHW
jgi:hypothetical protein